MKLKNIVTSVALAMLTSGISYGQAAKYIFLFIGDGMGASQVAVTESYLSYKAGKLGGEQLLFTQFPVYGTCTTHSLSSYITDSSAAGTAIATGTKTHNGMIGVDGDVNPVYSYCLDLQDMGYNIGIMSSVPVNHATPGAFYGHDASRGSYYKITTQIPEAGYKFFGGSEIIDFKGPVEGKNSEDYLVEHGYGVAFGQAEWDALEADKAVLLANPRSKYIEAYSSDVKDDGTVMSLASMMNNAINFIGDEKPFFIMCEGGEIDWVAHADKTMPLVEAICKMDDAVKVAYLFYLMHPDETLIVITADHETGGVSVGSEAAGYTLHWELLEEAWEQAGHVNSLNYQDNQDLNNAAGFGWTSTHHTGGPVPVFAIGKGSERFMGRMDNTQFREKFLSK